MEFCYNIKWKGSRKKDMMDEAQFEIGQILVYGTNGICIVDSIEKKSFAAGMPVEMYYVLKQYRNHDNRFFVPVKNQSMTCKIRELMHKEDIEDILMGMSDEDVHWNDNRRERTEIFKAILHGGVSAKLLAMITCIYERKRLVLRNGKKLPSSDATILKSAEKLVEEEFGYVLEIEPDEVPKYIRRRLHIREEEE